MRYFLFALGGAAVASLWWGVAIYGSGETNGREVIAVFASLALLVALVAISIAEEKL